MHLLLRLAISCIVFSSNHQLFTACSQIIVPKLTSNQVDSEVLPNSFVDHTLKISFALVSKFASDHHLSLNLQVLGELEIPYAVLGKVSKLN